MGKNKGTGRALTQEEIWDDSALVQSWDEAVEEYKLYHSIAAKGENVEDVLREAEAAAEAEAGPSMSWAQVEKDDDMADVDADAYEPAAAAVETHVSQAQAPDVAAEVKQPQDAAAGTAQTQAPTMPYPLLPQTQDEGLKNLMMAWYYAGYYTALYQEQQRASGNSTSS
ncbi:uncharacterized protein DSM5745_11035 [Aspergillus mulundensis]|uniref:Survival Motor Neuron Gemin2-binding domain-containing protein n=1 Tax=Aspergillus mulundensis TaxID=1810919 RepID=A0A3D8QCH3_9EURO|nr:Uncharacterized protein DSM5745_11035 [Aspergillus mulundensis]RDW59340.1 Uncharacterized protein DSM5745_11035 [Aspergillus mulundensis]